MSSLCHEDGRSTFQALYILEIKLEEISIYLEFKIKKENSFFKCLVPSNYHMFIFQFLLSLNTELNESDIFTSVLANEAQPILRKRTVMLWA